jgi:hypothetical protein
MATGLELFLVQCSSVEEDTWLISTCCLVHRARLDSEILYINLRASLAWKSDLRIMFETAALPTGVWAPEQLPSRTRASASLAKG